MPRAIRIVSRQGVVIFAFSASPLGPFANNIRTRVPSVMCATPASHGANAARGQRGTVCNMLSRVELNRESFLCNVEFSETGALTERSAWKRLSDL